MEGKRTNEGEEMPELQTLTKLKEIAQRLGKELEKDENNLSLLIFGSVATGKVLKKPDLDLLLITRSAPVEKEPRNVEEKIIDDETVQVSSVTPEQLEKDIGNFVDYRINQIQNGIIIFDKEGLLRRIKKELTDETTPPAEILQAWFSELKEDQEILPQKLDNKAEFLFLANRSALWTLRIFLSLKRDPFQGPKYLEEHLEHFPEIKDLFLRAFGSNFIDLKIKPRVKGIIPFGGRNIYLNIIRDMLIDSDELEEKGKITAAKMSLLEALTYFGLYLQEKGGLESWEELIKKDSLFVELVEQAFDGADPKSLLQDNLEFNNLSANLIQRQLGSVDL